MKPCPPAKYLSLCRTQGSAWCRYTLMHDDGRLLYYMLATLVTVGWGD